MNTGIYYFSGLIIPYMFAKKLEKQISEAELIPMVSLLNEDVVETPGNCSICFSIHLSQFAVRTLVTRFKISKLHV